MGLNVKYKLLQNLWEPISDINTYWSKALQRLAFIFMGLKFLIQTAEISEQLEQRSKIRVFTFGENTQIFVEFGDEKI